VNAPATNIQRVSETVSPWRFLATLMRPHRRVLALFGVAVSLAAVISVGSSVLLSRFVRLAVDRAPTRQLVLIAACYALLGLASAAMSVFVTFRANVAAWAITNQLRHQLTDDVLRADLAFHRDRTPGELVTRVDGDITSVNQFLAVVVATVISACVLAIGCVVVSLVIEPWLTPLLVIGFVGLTIVTLKMREYPVQQTVAERAAEAETMSAAEQYLSGAEDLASLRAGQFAVARFADHATVLVDRVKIRTRRQMTMQGVISFAAQCTSLLMIAGGAVLMAADQLDVAGVVLGMRLAQVVADKVQHLVWRLQDAQGALGAAQRVTELALLRTEVPTGTTTLDAAPTSVVFDDVHLVYDDDAGTNAALQHLTLTLEPGRTLGVVGRSGSGKTSLARLVLRLVEPSGGSLQIGGIPIREIDEASFRQRVTAVPQDVQLFPGSVRQNVTLFAERDDAEVINALTRVGLYEWVMGLPDGLETRLAADDRDDGGTRVGLSAGQAQLLALARAMLRNPSVVILDEATSRIDPSTQASLATAMGELVSGRTALIIAHRLETLQTCDDIVVLDHGRVVEYGRRDALAKNQESHYARILRVGHDAEELL
jgi:ABC-type multidrug transport system fused ATPase/permease subunit